MVTDLTTAEAALSAEMDAPVVVDAPAPIGQDIAVDDCGFLAYLPQGVSAEDVDVELFRELVVA